MVRSPVDLAINAAASHTVPASELTDEQWAIVASLIPTPPRRANRRGRPMRAPREVLSGVLWVLRHSAPWHELPKTFPSYQTCHRRFRQWVNDGTLRLVLEALEKDLQERGGLQVTEWLSSYTSADDERRAAEQRTRSWQQQTAMLFLSRATLRLLRRLRSPLALRLSNRYSAQAKLLVTACSVLAFCSLAEAAA